jgi:hypothetical protein
MCRGDSASPRRTTTLVVLIRGGVVFRSTTGREMRFFFSLTHCKISSVPRLCEQPVRIRDFRRGVHRLVSRGIDRAAQYTGVVIDVSSALPAYERAVAGHCAQPVPNSYANNAFRTSRAFSLVVSTSTRSRAKSIAVPGPWLVMIVPCRTTRSSSTRCAPGISSPG